MVKRKRGEREKEKQEQKTHLESNHSISLAAQGGIVQAHKAANVLGGLAGSTVASSDIAERLGSQSDQLVVINVEASDDDWALLDCIGQEIAGSSSAQSRWVGCHKWQTEALIAERNGMSALQQCKRWAGIELGDFQSQSLLHVLDFMVRELGREHSL